AAAPEDNHGTTEADSALRAAKTIALDDIVTRPPELASATSEKAAFARNNGWPQYTRTIEGHGLTFPFNGAGVITLQMDAMLHDTEAQAQDRVRRVVPRGGTAAPSERLVREVRRVIQAERAVDSLVDAHDYPAAFATIDRAGLARAPVGFWTRTWNKVCWWASLNGLAQRA